LVDLVIEFDNFAIGLTFALVPADDFDEVSCLAFNMPALVC
jgi:hypothetical protein